MQRPAASWRPLAWSSALAICTAYSTAQQPPPAPLGAVTSWEAAGHSVRASVQAGAGVAQLTITETDPQVLRIQVGPPGGEAEPAKPSPDLKAAEEGDDLVVRTAALELRVHRNPFGLTLRDVASGLSLLDTAATGDDDAGGMRLGANRAELRFVLAPNEHFYGLGGKFDALDQRGHEVQNWVRDAMASLDDTSYVCIPFFISSRGYGLWLNSAMPSICDFGSRVPKVGRVVVAEPRFDAYLIYGPDPAAILDHFTDLTGRPTLPPQWAFLPWVSRDAYQTQDEVLAVARRMADLHLPCGVVVIEGWKAGRSWEFAADRFPDPAAMLKELHQLGMHALLYVLPTVHPRDPAFADAAAKGFFVKDQHGQPARLDSYWLRGRALVDFTNPDAVTWWQGLHRPLLKTGVDGFKVGDGEQVRSDMVFANGLTGSAVHNVYPNLFQQAMQDLVQAELKGGLIWARAGTTGIQKSACVWAGDQVSDFDHLRATIRAGLSSAMSGVPFWGHDIGGYWGRDVGGRQLPPTKALFIRWLQFGTFSPIMQLHGRDAREPWAFDDETLAIYRRCATLRANLLPYIYTSAVEAANEGMPLMRPLALAFPEDYQSATVDDEYLFGPDLLVAPVCEDGATGRDVYLPPGVWFDFWENTVYDGAQTIHREVDLASIPLFVRAGAIIPMELAAGRQPGQSVETPSFLTFDIYPHGKSHGGVQDGDAFTDVTCERTEAQLDISVGRRARPCWLRVFCSAPRSVEVDGKEVRPEGRSAEGMSFWRYDANTQRLLVQLGGAQPSHIVAKGVPGPTVFANIVFPRQVCSAEESIAVEADVFNLPVAAEPMLEWEAAGQRQPARTGIPVDALRWQFRVPVAGPISRDLSLRFRLVADVDRLAFPATTDKRRITLVAPVQATLQVNGSRVVGSAPMDVEVDLRNQWSRESAGTVTLTVPDGADVEPTASQRYAVAPTPATAPLHFDVRMPATLTVGEHEIDAHVEWLNHDMGAVSTTVTDEPTWAVIGPFPNDSGRGFRAVYPPEQKVDLGAKVNGTNGPVGWQVYPREQFAHDGFLDFLKAFPGQEWVAAYAVAYVESPTQRQIEIRVGHDDGVIVWLNGQQIISRDVYQVASPDQAVAPAQLREGINEIRVKLCQGHSDWQLYFRITGPGGTPLSGLRDAGLNLFKPLPVVQVAPTT